MTETVLILGASGRFGRSAAEAFERAGWAVRRFDRKTGDLARAAAGADVIVNGWNPPYTDWAATVPGLTRQVIDAARASGATVIVPGNVYVFGADAPEVFGRETPHRARNGLGRVRIEMEAAYRAAGVRTIVLRTGDFIDVRASGNWFDRVMIAGLGKGRFTFPGALDVPHAWAWLPDVARAAVALAERRDALAVFEDVPFEGYTLTGRQLCDAVAQAAGRPLRLTRMSWLPLQLLWPVWPMARRLIEMRYLWSQPHRLDGARLADLLPEFRATPVEVALARAMEHQIHPDKVVAQGSRAAEPVA